METLTDGARRSRKCGEGFIRGTKTLAYRRLSNGHLFLALTLLTEQGKTPVSALHHRNVNKLLETLASRPCLFSWVEPWENTTLDSGLLCLFYVLSVRLLLQFSVYGWEDLCVYIWPLYIVKEKKGKLVLQHSELGYWQYRQKREDWFPALKKNKTKSIFFRTRACPHKPHPNPASYL